MFLLAPLPPGKPELLMPPTSAGCARQMAILPTAAGPASLHVSEIADDSLNVTDIPLTLLRRSLRV